MKLPIRAIEKFWRSAWRSAWRSTWRSTLIAGGAIAASLVISVESAIAQIYEFGDEGTAVAEIQRALGIFPDGIFGVATEDAIMLFQADQGLVVDGIAGPSTLQALGLGYLTHVGSGGGGFNTGFGGGGFNTGFGGGGFVPGATTAVVRTSSGIGVNVRNTPNGAQVGGVDDGTRVSLTGATEFAGGRQWAQLVGGGWVATEFLVEDGSIGGGGTFPGGGGGFLPPIATLPAPSIIEGPYVVAVPGGSRQDLARAQQISRVARIDTSSQGSFINAGGYSSREDAEALAAILRFNGLDARVTFRRYY